MGPQAKDTIKVAQIPHGAGSGLRAGAWHLAQLCHPEWHWAAHFPLDTSASSTVECYLSQMTPDLKF